jgi:uncharacterized protein (TIGR02271 family)
MHSYEELRQWQDHDLCDRNGDKIGKIDDFYLDTDTKRPEWAVVNTGFLGLKSNFVPATEIRENGECLYVPYDKDMVKDAPSVDADSELSEEEEIRLYDYYGLDRSYAWSSTGYADREEKTADFDRDSRADDRPSDGQSMTRSEETMDVHKVRRPSETVRLKKYVVTEPVQKTVPVSREEVRIEREPVREGDRRDRDPDIGEREYDVTLHEEQVRVDKDVKPVERVRLEKDVVRDEETVSDEVRKEKIDVDKNKRDAA